MCASAAYPVTVSAQPRQVAQVLADGATPGLVITRAAKCNCDTRSWKPGSVRFGADFEAITFGPESYAGCRSMADRIVRSRHLLMERRRNQGAR
jgi:hypothetical protein